MRRLGLVVFLALTGCPEWDAERIQRCQALGANSGVCDDVDAGAEGDAGPPDASVDAGSMDSGVDAGVLDAGQGDAGEGDAGQADGGEVDAGEVDAGAGEVDAGFDAGIPVDAGTLSSFPLFPSTGLKQSAGNTAPRLPVFLWELPARGLGVVVESRAGGFSIWREPEFGALDDKNFTWCASAANDLSTRVGTAYQQGGTFSVAVHNLDAGLVANLDFPLTHCAQALAAYVQADGGVGFVSATNDGLQVGLERTTCPTCMVEGFGAALAGPHVGEAVTDDAQSVWVSASGGFNELVLVKVLRGATTASVFPFATSPVSGVLVQLSTSGSKIHASWLEDQKLFVVQIALNGAVENSKSWALPGPVRLVDLVENSNSVVAILEFGDQTVVFNVTHETFHRVSAPVRLRANVAHLKSKLRIAGQCDGGTSCTMSNNPVLEFDTRPDGGAW